MKRVLTALLVGVGLTALTAARAEDKKPAAAAAAPTNEVAVLKFKDFGDITFEFLPGVAPKTVENFKKLAREKFYDGTKSHRLIPGFMIQLGDPLTRNDAMQARWGTGDPGYKINAEFNDTSHVRGVVSMARSRDVNSAGSQGDPRHGRARQAGKGRRRRPARQHPDNSRRPRNRHPHRPPGRRQTSGEVIPFFP
jgi:hypothetical protein